MTAAVPRHNLSQSFKKHEVCHCFIGISCLQANFMWHKHHKITVHTLHGKAFTKGFLKKKTLDCNKKTKTPHPTMSY